MNIMNIANTCINLGYQPLHFKNLTSTIIPKPNKLVYNSPKTFCLTVLLNSLGKLIKKVISERLQNLLIVFGFIYPNQLGGLKFCSTANTSLYLTYLIHSDQIKDLYISTLALNIAQFFLSLDYQLLSLILDKVGLDHRISTFFSNYLINRKTQYIE